METGLMRPTGILTHKVIRGPKAPLTWKLANTLRWDYIKPLLGITFVKPVAKRFGLMTGYGTLEAVLIKSNGEKVNYGVVSQRVVTTAFCAFLATQLVTGTAEIDEFKFHDSGVGTTGENVADTAIETTDGESRSSGTQLNPTSVTYRTVATIAYTTTKAITEHGVFSAATLATLLDRSVFAAINVVNGDSIQFTYTLTLTAGG